MPQPVQDKTRAWIRQEIGYNLGAMLFSACTITKDKSSLWDTRGLQRGGTNEYVGRQVVIITPAGSIVAGEKGFVTAFDATEKDATITPEFTANITILDTYEMWKGFLYEEINSAIDRAFIQISDDALQLHQVTDQWTKPNTYEYDLSTTLVGLLSVEGVARTGKSLLIDACDSAWTAGSNVTATLDTSVKKEGTGCAKLVVADGAGATQLLGTIDFSSLDLSAYDTVELWIYSTIAITAGQLQLHLGDTSACASTVETIDIPALTAASWTRLELTLANPYSDTAVISAGIYQVADVGACTIYVDYILGILKGSRQYEELHRDLWSVVPASTAKLRLTPQGLSVVGSPTLLRLNGYKLPTLLTADTSTSEIDPDWVVAQVTANLLRSHAKARQLDIKDRQALAEEWQKIADQRKPSVTTQPDSMVEWTT